jgi:hypothetical protein
MSYRWSDCPGEQYIEAIAFEWLIEGWGKYYGTCVDLRGPIRKEETSNEYQDYIDAGKRYIVFVDNLQEEKSIQFILAHELRHIWQCENDVLMDGWLWSGINGNENIFEKILPYEEKPSERDADNYARQIGILI